MPFGKYNGLKLRDVPRPYLDWALSVESASRAMREFQGSARKFLGLWDAPREPGRLRRHNGDALSDPLSREFLAIVRNG